MTGKVIELTNIQGLTDREVLILREKYGHNVFRPESRFRFLHIVWGIVKEPMFILLVLASLLYFILGEYSEGIMLVIAMMFVAAISLYQEVKGSRAIEALKQFTEPKVRVLRDNNELVISNEDLVPGDIMLLDEGMNIPADAIILQENDLTIDESLITGESIPVEKHEDEGHNQLFQGTTINGGKCIARVTATGNLTVLGKLGKMVDTYVPPKTLLQLQISRFVKRLALFGMVGFFVILIVNYLQNQQWTASLLVALTLAMSAVPEEIPVAFSSFMALGAYKLSRLGVISRQPQVVENLGAVSVICLDKTGTITENKMQVKAIYDFILDELFILNVNGPKINSSVLKYGMLASETDPFDAMERAIWHAYHTNNESDTQPQLKMIYEYPLDGKPPMMTHVYEDGHAKTVAAKGAAERIIRVCRLNETEKEKILSQVKSLASKGYRIIAVANAIHTSLPLPSIQDNFDWKFQGLLALYDPPKENIAAVMKQFYDAKIEVKLVTGDYPETAMNIAGQVGIRDPMHFHSGEDVMGMDYNELKVATTNTNIFARMFPDAKLKLINALKENDEIVAMTGDGVNDGPALKSANVGIAMGNKGTEIARLASDLILTDDNLAKIVTAIREGRKIFSNLIKAVRYIISIHIPIILIASLPVLFGWTFPNIFTPIHVIFLELIMGPTCSIFFEREPVEGTIMEQGPRQRNHGLFAWKELTVSIVQGVIIASGALSLYYYFMSHGASVEQTRNMVFTTLILSNLFLTFVNRSFTESIIHTLRYKNNLAPIIIIVSVVFLALLQFVPEVRALFSLAPITPGQFWLCFAVALACVMWLELYKMSRNIAQ